MRYFIYISDTKVDMLFSQIPQKALEKIAAELTLDLKVLKLSVKEKPSEETRYSKLSVVEKYLADYSRIGTVDEPKSYFTGALPMRWTILTDWMNFVYFAGATRQTLVGLGGSGKHVIGSAPETYEALSVTPRIHLAIAKWLGEVRPTTDEEDWPYYYHRGMTSQQRMLADVAEFSRTVEGAEQRVRFLAKRLAEGSLEPNIERHFAWKPWPWPTPVPRRLLLGTPLYVEQLD